MKLIERLLGKRRSALATAPLSLKEDKGAGAICFAVGALTDKGRAREHNQDAYFVLNMALSQGDDLLPMGLYIVSDGMGGPEVGEAASALAVRLVASWVLDKIYRPFLLDSDPSADRQPIHQVLREAVIRASGRVNQQCPGGGSTLTCALVLGTNAFVAHVGDSRAYVIDSSSIRRITTDHSLVNRLIELGQITPEEAKAHPQRNVLYRALGRAGDLEVDTLLQSFPQGSTLLLCSDGLWRVASEKVLSSIVNGAPSPQVACQQLIAYANECGGEDNVTVVLVQAKH